MSNLSVELNYKSIILEQLFINRVQDSEGELTASFSLSELKKRFNMEKCSMNDFHNLMLDIVRSTVKYVNENGNECYVSIYSIFRIYKDDNLGWCVEITVNEKAYDVIRNRKKARSEYLEKLKSLAIVRLYVLLHMSRKENEKDFEISVSELRYQLFISDDEYKRWDNFKRKVLDAGRSQINEITDLEFSYERGKTGLGGKWETIIFHITDKS